MGIIRYIPRQSAVNDRRTEEGGYYEAVCSCGQHFYPKRSDAVYCSNRCAVIAHHARKAEAKRKKVEWALEEAKKFRP